jgi:toxin HigB-1
MIRSFKSKETEKIFSRQKSALFSEEMQRLALRELRVLDQSLVAKESWVPANGNGTHGDSRRYIIPFSDQWRIAFEWHDGHAYDVDIVGET